jgi:hypothetical protein
MLIDGAHAYNREGGGGLAAEHDLRRSITEEINITHSLDKEKKSKLPS